MAVVWHVLHSKPNKEYLLWRHLVDEGFETFYPCVKLKERTRRLGGLQPYFPGYLFVRVDLTAVGTSMFQWMPHAIGLVHYGTIPAQMPAEAIDALQEYLEAINRGRKPPLPTFQQGEKVVVQSGPFQGYEAIFDATLNGSTRVRVLLQLLNTRQHTIPLQLEATNLKPSKR
jgi:transcription antitermination factor NusG